MIFISRPQSGPLSQNLMEFLMIKYRLMIVAALCVLVAAPLSIAAQPDQKAPHLDEFDMPSPTAERSQGEQPTSSPALPQSLTVASSPRDGATSRATDAAGSVLPSGPVNLQDQIPALKGILSYIIPSKDDLEKTLDSIVSPSDTPNARPGPHWKVSHRGK